MLEIDASFYVLILGLAIGFVSGFLGLGGGILIVPLLPLVVPLDYYEVVATSLFTILIVVSNNTIQFSRAKLVNWRIAGIMGPVTAVSAFSSAKLGLTIDPLLLTYLLSSVYILMALWTLFTRQPKITSESRRISGPQYVILLFSAALAGSLSGLTGIGSGMILGAFLLNLKLVPVSRLTPTTNAIMMFTCLSGVLAYGSEVVDFSTMRWGRVHLNISILLFIGAFASSYFARKWQHLLSADKRRWILGLLLVILGAKVIYTVNL